MDQVFQLRFVANLWRWMKRRQTDLAKDLPEEIEMETERVCGLHWGKSTRQQKDEVNLKRNPKKADRSLILYDPESMVMGVQQMNVMCIRTDVVFLL